MPIPFVPHTCFFLGSLTTWHKDSGRGLILPGQLRSISWVDETFKSRQDRAASENLSLHKHGGSIWAMGWKEGVSSFLGSTHPGACSQPLPNSLGASGQLFVSFLGTAGMKLLLS